MDTQYELELTETFYYSISNNPSIKEITESLQGWEVIIKQSRGILAELTGSHILDIEVRVQKLEVGSLTEKILIKLGFGSEAEFDTGPCRALTRSAPALPPQQVQRKLYSQIRFAPCLRLFHIHTTSPYAGLYLDSNG